MKNILTKISFDSLVLNKKVTFIYLATAICFIMFSFDKSSASVEVSNTLNYFNNAFNNKAFLNEINSKRSEFGAKELEENTELDKLAQDRLSDMIENNYFAHVSPDKKSVDDLLQKSSYDYIIRGENLAYGEFEDEKDVVKSWMQSEGHRNNILYKDFDDVGTASIFTEYQGGKYFVIVQVFGSEKSKENYANDFFSKALTKLKLVI